LFTKYVIAYSKLVSIDLSVSTFTSAYGPAIFIYGYVFILSICLSKFAVVVPPKIVIPSRADFI